MTIEIQDGRYFAAIWFVGPGTTPDGRKVDIHGALWRDAGASWVLRYRFRYHNDDRVDASSTDDKSWYQGDLKSADGEPETDIVARITRAFESMAVAMGCTAGDVAVVPVQSADAATVAEKITKQPWAHVQMTGRGGDA